VILAAMMDQLKVYIQHKSPYVPQSLQICSFRRSVFNFSVQILIFTSSLLLSQVFLPLNRRDILSYWIPLPLQLLPACIFLMSTTRSIDDSTPYSSARRYVSTVLFSGSPLIDTITTSQLIAMIFRVFFSQVMLG